jgi:flagellar protein FlbD
VLTQSRFHSRQVRTGRALVLFLNSLSNPVPLPMEQKTGGCLKMIEVTRLNGNAMTINSDLIKIAESSPDTMLTLIHGDKLIVRESCSEIVDKIVAYRARLLEAVATTGKSGQHTDLHRLVALTSLSKEPASK